MANVTANARRAARAGEKAPGLAPRIDLATVVGVFGALAVIATAMVVGGSPSAFIDIPAVLIVFGGTFLVTTASFSLEEIVQSQGLMARAALYHAEAPETAARRMLYYADRARKVGPLGLESIVRRSSPGRFLSLALQLVADGLPTEEIEHILGREREATHLRHIRSASVLRRAGEVAPAMGLIGTLVGLVQMLGNLEDPATIGPSMAVALLTTFYGAILANMVFHPLASKLERNSETEALVNQIYTLGAASISRQENPRRLELMLNTMLSPARRVSVFD